MPQFPISSGSAHIPVLLWAHCSPRQAWFKGSQVMKSLPHHLNVCFPQIAPFKVENSQKKIKLAPLSSSWRFKSLSPLQTRLKWRIAGAKLGSRNGAPEGPCGERALPGASSATESLCQTQNTQNKWCVFTANQPDSSLQTEVGVFKTNSGQKCLFCLQDFALQVVVSEDGIFQPA